MTIIDPRDFGADLEHHFGDDGSGVYMKQVRLPAGLKLPLHSHTFTHKSVLCDGRVRLTVAGVAREVAGPAVLVIERGVQHEVEALEDSTWLCVHATDECDPERIDHVLIGAAS